MVWVYDRTRSLLVAILMHTSLTASSLVLGPGVAGVHLVTFDLIWAAALWVVFAAVAVAQGGHLSRQPRHPLRRRAALSREAHRLEQEEGAIVPRTSARERAWASSRRALRPSSRCARLVQRHLMKSPHTGPRLRPSRPCRSYTAWHGVDTSTQTFLVTLHLRPPIHSSPCCSSLPCRLRLSCPHVLCADKIKP